MPHILDIKMIELVASFQYVMLCSEEWVGL